MALHHLTKKSAVEKYSALKDQLTAEELKKLISEDEKKYDESAIAEIMQALGGEGAAPLEKPAEKEKEKPKSQSEELGLDKFNYKALIDGADRKPFTDYNKLVAGLQLQKMFDFECYAAAPVKKQRYEGLAGSPVDLIGIEIKLDKPLNVTRLETRHAIELNRQLENSNRYYLLKK